MLYTIGTIYRSIYLGTYIACSWLFVLVNRVTLTARGAAAGPNVGPTSFSHCSKKYIQSTFLSYRAIPIALSSHLLLLPLQIHAYSTRTAYCVTTMRRRVERSRRLPDRPSKSMLSGRCAFARPPLAYSARIRGV